VRVHASTQNLLVAALRERRIDFTADIIETAEVLDDGKQIAIRPANPKDKLMLNLPAICQALSRVGLADRTVEVAGAGPPDRADLEKTRGSKLEHVSLCITKEGDS
jgi:hypothetical protein